VNNSSAKKFDATLETIYSTLPELLSAYSPMFKVKFDALQAKVNAKHPFEYFMTNYPAYPWLVREKPHQADSGKTLDLVFRSSEIIDTLNARDFNDDIQTSRELPREHAQERISRDQALYRSHADFIEAAVKGAIGIVHKTIQPLNPNEDELAQMYIHNNLFFSEGYDNKEQFEKYGGAAAAHVAVSKDIDGIEMVSSLDIEGIHTLGTVLVDYKGHRIVCQTIVPGILKKAGTGESTIQYGSVDGGNEILSNKDFEEIVSSLSNFLHLQKHVVVDGQGQEHDLSTSVETKWIQGTDSRRYILDLYRLCPVDALFLETVREETDIPYPHEMVLLRPELVKAYYQHKLRFALKEYQEKLEEKQKEAKEGEEVEKGDFEFKISLNPDSFTHINLGKDKEKIEKDREAVRDASGFVSLAISQLLLELVQYTNASPIETCQLTSFFHKRGVNMRYLGKVASLVDKVTESRLGPMKQLLKEEMASRVLKHVLREELLHTSMHQTSELISYFFNLMLAIKMGTEIPQSSLTQLTADTLKNVVHSGVKSRFRYDLGQEFWGSVGPVLFRSICLKVGIQIRAREYNFNTLTFHTTDILNLYPVIKHAQPRAGFAVEAYEHGRVSLAQKQKELGMELIRESVSMLEQIYGPVHADSGRAYANLAALYYNDEQPKQAIAMQRRAVIVLERTLGFDHPETLTQYVFFVHVDVFGHLRICPRKCECWHQIPCTCIEYYEIFVGN
jgi:protein TIF31